MRKIFLKFLTIFSLNILITLLLLFTFTLSDVGEVKNIQQQETNDISIIVVYDNNPYKEGLETSWGFSCFIEGTEKTILFDTGGDGYLFMKNLKKLGIDPKNVDVIFLSHIHGDHTGGLSDFLEKNLEVTVYVPKSFPKRFKDNVQKYGAKVIEVREHIKICKTVCSTGELGTWIKEQSLIIQTDKGLILITGCAHPVILEIIEKAKDLMKDDVLFIMGGFHLVGKSTGEIDKIVSNFRKLGVRYVGPCHCSGDLTRKIFAKEYGERYLNVGVGRFINVKRLKVNTHIKSLGFKTNIFLKRHGLHNISGKGTLLSLLHP